jgi:hypothetical protein
MPFTSVHIFTSLAGITYYILVDYDTGVVTEAHSPADTPPEPTMTEAELGFGTGQTIQSRCNGTTLQVVAALLTYPFAQLVEIPNSVECGFTPPACTFNWENSVVNSVNGGNNGKITMLPDIVDPVAYQFSLDNVDWQTSPVFNFLFPGSYQVYVRDEDGCVKSYIITVGNDVVVIPTIPPTIAFADAKRICYFFRLIIDEVVHTIREPIKWDGVNIIGERDADYHGYNFKYTDGNVNLGFDCAAGKELIEEVYNTRGQDGEILFQYGYTYAGDEYILFPGKLMLNTYKWYPEKVECTVESEDLDTAFTSRLDTKVSMTQDKSFDNEDVPVPTPYSLNLHPKEIETKVSTDTSGKTYVSMAYSSETDAIYIKPDNTEVIFSEILDNYQYPIGDQVSDPKTIEEYIIKPKSAGTAQVVINLDLDVAMSFLGLFVNTNYTAKVMYVRRKFFVGPNAYGVIETDITTIPVSGNFTGTVGTVNFNIKGSLTVSEDFLVDDEVYCYVTIAFDDNDNKYRFSLTQNNFKFEFTYLEQSAATPANTWFLEDVIRHCTNVISNNKYAFKSTFFQRQGPTQLTDGCGSKYTLTNGFQIRQFEIASRPLKIDLKKVLKSINAIFCIGLGYTNDSTGSVLRIERREYFYQDREIIAISELESYKEEVAIDIIYNELEHGYEKYQDSGFNSLDEFNTKTEWLTPIKKNKKKLSQLSSFIASGYSIEAIRREQFKEKPSSSVSNDEEPFIVAVKRVDAANWETEKDEAFETVTGIISTTSAYNLRISPKRMLYNWFIWLKGIFAYKVDADKITNTFIAQNNALITKFDVAETCRVGDVDRATIEEKADVPMTALATTADIYRPERVFIKCRLSPQDIQVINLAMTDRLDSTKDLGYIMVLKPTGVWQAVWLEKLSYNYWTEKAEISGLKKHTSPDEPQEPPCCPWLVVNGCYIKANGIKLIA